MTPTPTKITTARENAQDTAAELSFPTLDTLTATLQKQGRTQPHEMESTLHAATMLAFVEATHAVMHQSTMPTPMGRLRYDKRTNTVKYTPLQGRAPVPVDDALDFSMLDFLLASLKKERM